MSYILCLSSNIRPLPLLHLRRSANINRIFRYPGKKRQPKPWILPIPFYRNRGSSICSKQIGINSFVPNLSTCYPLFGLFKPFLFTWHPNIIMRHYTDLRIQNWQQTPCIRHRDRDTDRHPDLTSDRHMESVAYSGFFAWGQRPIDKSRIPPLQTFYSRRQRRSRVEIQILA